MAKLIDDRMARLDALIAEFGDEEFIGSPTLRSRNVVGDAVIHRIAGRGEVDLIDLVVAQGESPDTRGEWDWTPLHTAVCCKKWEMVVRLLDLGADPTLVDDMDDTPLDFAREGNAPQHILDILGAAVARRASTQN